MKIKLFFTSCLLYIFLFNQVFAQILFSEIFPNTDDDTILEYIELYNSGSLIQSLSGFVLKDKSEKEFVFGSGEVLGTGELKKYFRDDTKILLNNSDEELFLYDNSGTLIDSFSYTGTVKGEIINIISLINEESNTGIIDNFSTGGIDTSTGIIDTSSGIIDTSTGNTEVFNLVFDFQNPSYILDKEQILSEYICDNNESECKINLDLRNSFTGSFKESDFDCKINFGFNGWLNGEEEKCNPNTIIFPKGEFDLNFNITSKTNSLLVFTGGFLLKNVVEKEIVEVEKIVTEYKTEFIEKIVYVDKEINEEIIKDKEIKILEKIEIEKPDIIIQSGLDENNNCKKEDCKLNLNYEIKNEQERCLWFFDGGVFSEGTDKKCNPGYVDYGLGEYEVKLKVYQNGDEGNFNESVLEFRNLEDKKITSPQPSPQGEGVEKKYLNIKINKVMPNPSGSDTLEYVELINNSDVDINLKGCSLDDKIDGGSSKFIFLEDDFILKGKTKKYYKSLTALNFNNDNDEVNLFCNDELVDSLKRNFKVADGYYLDHNRLDIKSSNAKVLKVIDGDTIEVQFLDSLLIEKLRFIGVDTPETKHPDNELEKYGIEAFEFTKNNLLGKKILVEIDNDNFRDSYSRLLGYVILDSENFNQKLIRLGYAKAYLNYPFKYSVEFKNSEKEAKNENLGIWKEDKNILKNIFVDDIDILVEEEDKVNLDDENKNNIPDEFDESLIGDESNTGGLVINEEYLSGIIEYNNLSSLDTINISEKNILKSAINVQGKIGVNKVLNGNTLTCYETCSVNFDGSNSEGSIEKYSWDFGNGEFFDGINPGYIKYEKYGKYKINLKIIGIDGVEKDSIFYVNFLEKNNVAKEEKNNESFEIIPLSYSNNSTATKPIIQTQLENDDLSLNGGTTKVEILLYLLIFIFSLNLGVLILKREKLM